MREFPPAAQLQFLLGLEIVQICLDPWSLQFRFLDGGQISVEFKTEHVDEDGQVHAYDCRDKTKTPVYLQQLLQQKIVGVDVEQLCLTLKFSTGALLRLFSEIGQCESGQIYPPPTRTAAIIVF